MRKGPIWFHFSADDSGIRQKTAIISQRMYSPIIHYCMTTTSTYHIPLSSTSELFCTLSDGGIVKESFVTHVLFFFFLKPQVSAYQPGP